MVWSTMIDLVSWSKAKTHILSTGSRDINPGLGEKGTGAQHEDDVENSMDGIL